MWDSRSLQKIKSTETIKTTPPIYGPTKWQVVQRRTFVSNSKTVKEKKEGDRFSVKPTHPLHNKPAQGRAWRHLPQLSPNLAMLREISSCLLSFNLALAQT
jgi:hypothetical protein